MLFTVHLAIPSLFTGMLVELKETNISTKHNSFKTINWQETDQLSMHAQAVGSTEKQLQLSGWMRPGLFERWIMLSIG